MRTKHIIPSFLLLFVAEFIAPASSFFYKSVTPAEGFPSEITCISAETDGYLWAGTTEGLARIDDSGVRLYRSSGEPRSLPNDLVYQVGEDARNNVWVLTAGGLCIYDRIEDNFRVFDDFAGQPVFSILADGDVVYFGGCNKVLLYSYADDELRVVHEFDSAIPFDVEAMYRDIDNSIFLFNREQGFLKYYPSESRLTTIRNNITGSYCAFLDSRGRFWRSCYNRGLECYDIGGDLLRTYTTENSDLSSDIILCITEHDGDIWVGTDGGGIDIINPFSGVITVLSHRTRQVSSIPDNSIAVLYSSEGGYMWAGRKEGGVLLLSDSHMRSFQIRPSGIKTENASDKINCIVRPEGSKYLWLGTHGSGLIRFNPTDESVFNFMETEDYEIVSMAVLPKGELLLSCFNQGLFVFNTVTGTLREFPHHDDGLTDWIRYSGRAVTLSTDYQGNVLIFAEAAYKYNPYTDKLTVPDLSLAHDNGHTVLPVKGSDGRYFVCEDNITVWNASTSDVNIICRAPEGTAFKDASLCDGKMWIASSTGLMKYDMASGELSAVPSHYFDSATAVYCTEGGRVWVGTRGALLLYLPEKDSFVKFDETDGVYANNFVPQSAAVFDGDLVLGGTNGFVFIDPYLSFEEAASPEIVLSDFYLDGVRIPYHGSLSIPHAHRNLILKAFVKEKTFLRSKAYRFKVKGPKGTDEYETASPELQLGFNVPGIYNVKASCTLKDGSWSDYQDIASYVVKAPWYISWWFLATILVFLTALLLAVYKFQSAVTREHEKARANQDHVRFLLNVSHELKTPLTLIINPLKRVIQNTDREDPDYERLQGILRQAQRMKSLILTVLSAHKIEEGSASLVPAPVDFNSWVGSLAMDFSEEAASRGTAFLQSFDPRIKNVDIDSSKLENVLTNILINAFKHTLNNSEIIVGTAMFDSGDKVRTYVKDRGPGLGGVDMTKLFNRYYQGVTEKTGSGMGLAYARTIVELHHGEMGAYENKDGAGSTFYFDIPISQGT